MSYPFPRKDIRHHVTALAERYHIDQTLRGRPDIVGHGRTLLDILKMTGEDERRLAANASLSSLGTTHLPPEELALSLIKFSEFDAASPALGLPVPAGVRHSLYQFSPLLQLAAECSDNRVVSGIKIRRLPLTEGDLIAYLYRSIGLPLPIADDDDAMTLDDPRVGLARAFEIRFGFGLEDLARRLIEISTIDADLYLLLLSREVEIADPVLARLVIGRANGCWRSEATFEKALKAVYELQRAAVMAWTLHNWSMVNVTNMLHLTSTTSSLACNAPIVAALASAGGQGNVLDQCQLHARAMRHYLRNKNEWAAVVDLHGILGSLKAGKLTWDHLTYAGGSEATLTIPQAIEDNCKPYRRQQGRGEGVRDSRLDLYCGIDSDLLPAMAFLEIGEWMGRSVRQVHFDHLIAAQAQTVGKPIALHQETGKHRRDKARRFSKNYLPSSGGGSAGRFDPSQWGRRFADRSFWQSFVTSIHAALSGRRSRRSGDLRLLDLALLLVTRRFKAVFASFRAAPVVIDLMCDLATSICQLTTEPILGAILTREEHRRNKERQIRRRIRSG